jgi:hypothetical protein
MMALILLTVTDGSVRFGIPNFAAPRKRDSTTQRWQDAVVFLVAQFPIGQFRQS